MRELPTALRRAATANESFDREIGYDVGTNNKTRLAHIRLVY